MFCRIGSGKNIGFFNESQGKQVRFWRKSGKDVRKIPYKPCLGECIVLMASLGGEGQPAPDVTVLGWHNIMIWNYNSIDLGWIPYFFHFVRSSLSSFGLKNPLIFKRKPFFGLHILLDQKPTYFAASIFFLWSSPIFSTKKRATMKSRPGCHRS